MSNFKISKNTIGILHMLVATFGWGLSFLLNKNLLHLLERNTLMTYRFIIGCSLLGLIFWKRLRKQTHLRTILCGLFIGGLLYINMFLTFKALETTDSGVAGVIMGSSIIWTQVLQALLQRKLPPPKILLAALLGFAGMSLLAWKGGKFTFASGEAISLCAGLLAGMMIVSYNYLLRKCKLDPTAFSIWECIWCGIMGCIGMLCLEHPTLALPCKDWCSLALLGFLCSGVCFLCIGRAQANLEAGRVGVLMALEPFFALLIGVAVAGEHVALLGYLGCACILAAAVLAGKPS